MSACHAGMRVKQHVSDATSRYEQLSVMLVLLVGVPSVDDSVMHLQPVPIRP